MRLIPLSGGLFVKVDDVDFERVSQYKWHPLRVKGKIYAQAYVSTSERNVYMHRMLATPIFGQYVDHRDGDGLNNQRRNLRPCSQGFNLANQRKWSKPTTSQFKGVSFDSRRDKWYAYIKIDRQRRWLGYFLKETEAAAAYNTAASSAWGEFARLNEL